MPKKICKDGRIWGQNNKSSSSHLGVSVRKVYQYKKKGFNPNSVGRKFKKGETSWNLGIKMTKEWKEKLRKNFFKPGAEHVAWQGGKSYELYPLGWNASFKEQIRCRDGFKCQVCGCPEIENARNLDVHHIDYDKKNLSPQNLVSLCRRCHGNTNSNRDRWRAFFSGKVLINA